MNENKKYFYGKAISQEGIERGYVDYSTFAHALGGIVLCNDITRICNELNLWDYAEEHNDGYNEEDCSYNEVFQYFLVNASETNLELLEEAHMHYILIEEYDLLIWCIEFYGMSWEYVMTDIKIDW